MLHGGEKGIRGPTNISSRLADAMRGGSKADQMSVFFADRFQGSTEQ